jgi:hypothetical protein
MDDKQEKDRKEGVVDIKAALFPLLITGASSFLRKRKNVLCCKELRITHFIPHQL